MSKNPIAYTAPHAVYQGGKLYAPGEPFVTDDTPGEKWEKVGKAEKAAADGAHYDPGDPPLESLGLEALKAVAITKKVNPDGLDKKGLIAAIKAANEPKL